MEKMQILLVCTGNTCRSPMAEGLLKAALQKDAVLSQNLRVSSAGLSAFAGETASKYAIRVLKDLFGVDIGMHRAKRLNSKDIRDARLILTMTSAQKKLILSEYPETADKVYTLKEFANCRDADIADPYGSSPEVYGACAEEIRAAVEKLVPELKKILLF